ncbi:valine--pyruvate transaminase [Gilvimarinus polysaccharolyticus]|uniref:valine--pyruvate transaminase n=1 Tax=Gilvimarinus polysaccharolyticus TaxID=863921 RepID=UPI0006732111|nr:valine--pyruvate transaminase [Gilvimarinus polysaccharolyticus]
MRLSKFGDTLSQGSGIFSLMEDLGSALRENPDMLFLGGGNPARIPQVEAALQQALQDVLNDPLKAQPMLGVYQAPAGDTALLDELAALFNREFQWGLTRRNLALANGSQSAFFVLFNLLAGEGADGVSRHIQLPLVPEYLGYSELGLAENFYRADRPAIELAGEHQFKYHVDFETFQVDPNSAALCVSRPTNPTGNVITDAEMAQLDAEAQKHGVPLIVDGAYGTPFPEIIFTDATPSWNDNTVLVLSLSKLGLPGVRTAVVIASEPLIESFARANTVLSLAAGNVGPAIARQLIASEQLLALGREAIAPFYYERATQTVTLLEQALQGLPFRIHKPEGAIFLWLWLEGLPITSEQLYQRLKARGVLVISGHHFFPGLNKPWRHQHECLRLSYGQPMEVVARAIIILADEVRAAYRTE